MLTVSDDASESGGDYDLAVITISNIVFDTADAVSSVTELTMDLFDVFGTYVLPDTFIDFGDDFVVISYDETAGGTAADFQLAEGGTATYQLGVADVAAVPLPASLPLLLAGLGGAALLRRRKG